ncbi:MAG: hypothetical protein VYC64_04800, partial [Candidatus Latescibacterota bacterium]|nr:hypothetical protein [Candidatus Latescibacterota bacterium]
MTLSQHVQYVRLPFLWVVLALFCLPVARFSQAANFDRTPGFDYPLPIEPTAPKPFRPEHYVVQRTIDPI